MKKGISWLEKIYQWMVHLYPAPFRDLFGEEMQMVFSLQIQEAENWRNVMGIVLLEVVHLPLSLIREHAAVQRRSLLLTHSGGLPMMSQPTSLYRWSLIGSVGLTSVLLILVILPFIHHGLDQLTASAIGSGGYDPKGFAPFVGDAGEPVYVLTVLTMLFMPFWSGLAGVVLSVSLLKHWRQLRTPQRLFGVISLLAICSLVIFFISPPGRIVFGWLLD